MSWAVTRQFTSSGLRRITGVRNARGRIQAAKQGQFQILICSLSSHAPESGRFDIPDSSSSGSAGANGKNGEEQLKRVKRLMKEQFSRQHYENVIRKLEDVRKAGQGDQLDTQDIGMGLASCAATADKPPYSYDKTKLVIAFWLFTRIENTAATSSTGHSSPIPSFFFEDIMKVCWATKERDKALNYLAKFNERNYQMTEPLLRHLILTLADDPVDSTFADDMEAYYKTYKTLKKDNNWTAESDVYEAVALSFAEFGEADNALNVLRDLVEAGMHPSEKLCSKMLTKSLLVGNLEIVRVVGNWYLSNFDVRLEYGILCKMLEMAASTGDHQIGSIAFQVSK